MTERMPVLLSDGLDRKYPECPRSVPWGMVAPHAAQAQANHGQTLERIAERGGLDPTELWAVVHDVPWRRAPNLPWAVAWLCEAVAGYSVRRVD